MEKKNQSQLQGKSPIRACRWIRRAGAGKSPDFFLFLSDFFLICMDPGLPGLGRGILILREALDQPPGSPALGQRHLRCHPTQPRDTRGSARTRTRTWDTGGFRIGRISPWSFAGKTNLELTGARGGGGRRRGRGGEPRVCTTPHSGVWIPISRRFAPFRSLDPNFPDFFPILESGSQFPGILSHSGVWIPIFTEFCPILESGTPISRRFAPFRSLHPSTSQPGRTPRDTEGRHLLHFGDNTEVLRDLLRILVSNPPWSPIKRGIFFFFGGGFVNPRAKSMLGEEMGEIPEVGFSSGSFEPRAFFFFLGRYSLFHHHYYYFEIGSVTTQKGELISRNMQQKSFLAGFKREKK
ncbi:uncharacterized protein LOC121658524 [Corvus kubaryi]|uniref:uncharacterized protein LOC121658524 n=1 Tax=Corvus kubaryi TaxID=68294 RepID=UPI001C0437F4|nr:uncharacterized protein LOC121658524 [Corvus kubaryi]